jgi:hypothetical protein
LDQGEAADFHGSIEWRVGGGESNQGFAGPAKVRQVSSMLATEAGAE